MRDAGGTGKGETLPAWGVYAYFESVAEEDTGAAVGAEGLAPYCAPTRFLIRIGGGVFFVGLFERGFRVEDGFSIAGGCTRHVHIPERALVVCELPLAEEA